MRILGIDPGLDTTGYGIIETEGRNLKLIEAGAITTSQDAGISERLFRIYDSLLVIIRKNNPQVLILEKLYSHYKHPTTAILMGHARGVICLASSATNIELVSYPAKTAKKAVTGNGNASKEQVQRMVATILGLQKIDGTLDVSDALALAISHVYLKVYTSSQIFDRISSENRQKRSSRSIAKLLSKRGVLATKF